MRAAVALGTNLGNREEQMDRAISALTRLSAPGEPFLVSRFYATAPVDCPPGSGEFVNAAVDFSPILSPRHLLSALQAIEAAMGRPSRRPTHAPRPMDLDILYFGDQILDEGDLIVPHPRIGVRRFVLAPLADIAPNLVLPGYSLTVAQLLASLPEDPGIRVL